MTSFTDSDIFRLDEQFALKGIPFHARPFHAVQEILGCQSLLVSLDNHLAREIQAAYARLIPEVDFTWPGMGTGLAASIDRVRKVTIGVSYGTVRLSTDKALGFADHQDWVLWCRHNQNIVDRSEFAFADMYDLVYGIDDALEESNAKTFWGLATEQLKLVSESLSQSGATGGAVLQPICLTAELGLKGTLLHLGVSEKDLRNPQIFGHNLINLAQRMVRDCPHRDDDLLLNVLKKFPDYVGDRYRETQLTRLEVIDLALGAQFVAASAVRRVSSADVAWQVETQGPGARRNFFS